MSNTRQIRWSTQKLKWWIVVIVKITQIYIIFMMLIVVIVKQETINSCLAKCLLCDLRYRLPITHYQTLHVHIYSNRIKSLFNLLLLLFNPFHSLRCSLPPTLANKDVRWIRPLMKYMNWYEANSSRCMVSCYRLTCVRLSTLHSAFAPHWKWSSLRCVTYRVSFTNPLPCCTLQILNWLQRISWFSVIARCGKEVKTGTHSAESCKMNWLHSWCNTENEMMICMITWKRNRIIIIIVKGVHLVRIRTDSRTNSRMLNVAICRLTKIRKAMYVVRLLHYMLTLC